MKNKPLQPARMATISQHHKQLGLAPPKHPLVGVFNFAELDYEDIEPQQFSLDFYCVAIKKNFSGKLKYGQHFYDFDEGVMSFIAPHQLLQVEAGESATQGSCLFFHPSLLAGHPLASKLEQYGFFSYALAEALHLSAQEETLVEQLFASIAKELDASIDPLSQQIVVAQIELLLHYSERFYKRQFITRNSGDHRTLERFEQVLQEITSDEFLARHGLPTVQQLAAALHFTPGYLSDLLRTLTGQSAQQHLHQKLVAKAKTLLTNTQLSVGEIAYQLGFEHPQSFSKLFKAKTQVSPQAFRASFN